MPTTKLTKKELLYLSALIGSDNMWGFDDPFQGKSEAEVRADLLEMQDTLVRKSCLDVAIDGQFTVSKLYSDLLRSCMDSSRVLVLSSSQLEAEHAQVRFFIGDNSVVRYQFRESAALEFITRELMITEIVGFFGNGTNDEDSCSLTTGVARLRRMGSLSKQRFLHELRSCGCEEGLALLIADGLQGNTDFCSLLAYDREGQQEKLTGKIVTLSFAGGSLMVTPGGSDPESVCFTKLNHDRLLYELNSVVGKREEVDIV